MYEGKQMRTNFSFSLKQKVKIREEKQIQTDRSRKHKVQETETETWETPKPKHSLKHDDLTETDLHTPGRGNKTQMKHSHHRGWGENKRRECIARHKENKINRKQQTRKSKDNLGGNNRRKINPPQPLCSSRPALLS